MVTKAGFLKFIMVVFCVAWLRGCGDSPAEPDGNGTFVPVALDISHEDGAIGGAFFDSAKDHFVIGEGGAQLPNELVYEIVVTNSLATPVREVVVTSELAPSSGILGCAETLAQDPAGGTNPNVGSVIVGDDCSSPGLFWAIGTLDPGAAAVLYFRAEALDDGGDVNRVTVTAEGLARDPDRGADPGRRAWPRVFHSAQTTAALRTTSSPARRNSMSLATGGAPIRTPSSMRSRSSTRAR